MIPVPVFVPYCHFKKGGLPKNDPVSVQLGCLARDGALQNRPHEGDELGGNVKVGIII
jgi:hypothetical protein